MKKIKSYKVKKIFSKPTTYLKKKIGRHGIWANKVTIEEDFDELPREFMKYFKS